MDYRRIALAAMVAWIVDAVYEMVIWIVTLGDQFASYPAVFRPQGEININLPLMLTAGLLGMFVLAYIYAKGYNGGNGVIEGLRFGLIVAVFTLCFVTIWMYGTLNVSAQLAILTGMTSFVEMVLIGAVIGSLYKPGEAHERPRVAPADKFA